MNYLIKGGLALLSDNGKYFTQEKDIYVSDGKISFIPPKDSEYEVINAAGQLVMPGLVNMHTHAYMSIFRNYADDVSFDEWLFKRIMPVEDTLEREDMLWTNLLSCIEMIQTGTTCFVDMHMFEGSSCQAAAESGLRAVIGRGLVGSDINGDGRERVEQALREKERYESSMIRFALAPHAIYSCNEDMYRQISELAAEMGLLKETHLSESIGEVENAKAQYGRSPVQIMADSGFLDGGRGEGRACHAVDVRIARGHQLLRQRLQRRAAHLGGFGVAGDFSGGDLSVLDGQAHGHRAAEAGSLRGQGLAQRGQRKGQHQDKQKRKCFLHGDTSFFADNCAVLLIDMGLVENN